MKPTTSTKGVNSSHAPSTAPPFPEEPPSCAPESTSEATLEDTAFLLTELSSLKLKQDRLQNELNRRKISTTSSPIALSTSALSQEPNLQLIRLPFSINNVNDLAREYWPTLASNITIFANTFTVINLVNYSKKNITHIPHYHLTRHYGTGQILDTLLKTSFKQGGAECGI